MTEPLSSNCPRALAWLESIIRNFEPDLAFLLKGLDEPVIVAAMPSPQKAWSARSPEALEHVLQGGPPQVFAAPQQDAPALAALLGSHLDVVMVGAFPDSQYIFYLSRSIQRGLYQQSDLDKVLSTHGRLEGPLPDDVEPPTHESEAL